VLSLILAFVIAFLTAFLGYSTIARIQTIISYIFGALTVIAMGLLIPHIDGAKLLRIPSGHWLTGFVPAVSIIIAGTGLSWISTGSDYTRYLPAHTPPHKVAWATAWGGMIPTFFLMLFGILLFASMPQLLTAPNPTTILKDALPVWMAIPYLLAAAAGMIASDVLNIYSAGLSLQAANVKIPRTRTIILDAVISIGLSLFILLAAQNFLGTLEGLLTILAAALAPWAAIFLVDLLRHWKSGHMVSELFNGAQSRYGAVRGKTLIFWVLGFVISMLFTSIPGIFTGPLAVGIFNGSNLGFIVGFVVTWILTATLSRPSDKEALQSEAGTA
jgi:purine-cytosine permease-like protein